MFTSKIRTTHMPAWFHAVSKGIAVPRV